MAWTNSKIVAVLLAATVIAVLFAPLSGVITSGTGDVDVTNESVTASTGEYVDLDGYNVENGETVYWLNDTSGNWETVSSPDDYELAYDRGAIQANSSGTINDGDSLRVNYTYAATDGTTGRIAEFIPMFVVLLMLVAIAGPMMKEMG